MKGVEKFLAESLSFLDNFWVRVLLIALIIAYIVGVLPFLTSEVARVFHNPVVKVLVLVFIAYVAIKDLPLALLLGLAFVLSLFVGYQYQFGVSVGPGLSGSVRVGAGGDGGPSASFEAKAEAFSTETDNPKGGNYNQYSDCTKECAEGTSGGSLDTPCKGTGVWDNELNAQGLNCPSGYSGGRVGSPF